MASVCALAILVNIQVWYMYATLSAAKCPALNTAPAQRAWYRGHVWKCLNTVHELVRIYVSYNIVPRYINLRYLFAIYTLNVCFLLLLNCLNGVLPHIYWPVSTCANRERKSSFPSLTNLRRKKFALDRLLRYSGIESVRSRPPTSI